jgi:L-seryl-tRNA(Ser) seleniumtransferase
LSQLAHIPKVDRVLLWTEVRALLDAHPRPVVVAAVRAVLATLRTEMLRQDGSPELPDETELAARIGRHLNEVTATSQKRVINGTGVVIHTNLGRAPLADSVREILAELASGYTNLEYDLGEGVRSTRSQHVEPLLCELTGAEAALVVNNNAAAVLLALSSLAAGREVIVSRGELVEIGGSFRIPDIMSQSGALLREVGTTNRTHPLDYRRAISPETSLLLKVHCSNFAVVGFTAEVPVAELVAIGREHGLPVMADAGSGNLLELSSHTGCHEPPVAEYVTAGVDLVTFSGDKLLGGPQAGIIVGKANIVGPLKRHPLLRALRIDRLTLAALEATLRLYRDERQALAQVPVLRMLTASREDLAERGRTLLRRLRRLVPGTVVLSLRDGISQVGGGALPLAELPTTLLVVRAGNLSPQDIERRLRTAPIPVIGRIHRGEYLLDLRTLLPHDEAPLVTALTTLTP